MHARAGLRDRYAPVWEAILLYADPFPVRPATRSPCAFFWYMREAASTILRGRPRAIANVPADTLVA